MIDQICSQSNSINAIGLIFLLILEAWLGKTGKTKSGSTLELVFNVLSKIFKRHPLKE